ncbi:hypothetical protein CPB83DRAFT_865157 [Crepidotus variabilis]|uniref:Uncharacterized protein n=1 Tax=Crepidotus variabilis TaxID=179855 RepID=A0A9P6E3J6_9AGAR|nr:hypothetical protein CPB83DRAFT_865157 [Crepidotus variabilis]
MQIYVSRVTVDWVKLRANEKRDFFPSLGFPEEFFATSDRRIACASLYISLLHVRNAWLKHDIPIFAMIQHFCSHGGYRNIFCRIVTDPKANISRNQFFAMGEDDGFNTEILSLDQVLASSWSKIPHITMVGMSCEGNIEDFRRRLLESQQRLLPVDHRCGEADDCAHTISGTNISRLLVHFFAQHEQFPFRLRGVENQFDRVAGGLNKYFGKEAEETFMEARFGADEFGTGRSTRLATIEHFCLEYPHIFSKERWRLWRKTTGFWL